MLWAMLPPEINSARMYTGPGPESLLSAASAWDGLAAELHATARSYGSVVSELTGGPWLGPAAASMAAAAAPYVTWMSTTAAQAQQTAAQAMAAVAAFEQAFAMTVPPPVIAANRALLQSLVATNILGQNTPAIMATEAAYAEMWAQDAAAMSGYASGSATATQLTPFIAPQQNANPAGQAAQSAAVNQAATATAGNAQTTVSQLTSALSQPSSGTTPAATSAQTINFDNLWGYIWDTEGGAYDGLAGLGVLTAVSNTYSVAARPAGIPLAQSLASGIGPVLNKIVGGLGALNGGSILHSAGLGGGGVAAAVGQAASLGPMSVPSGWTVPATTATAAMSGTPLTTLPAAEAGMPGVPGYPGMPFAGTARGGGVVPRYGVRLAVMARPLSGG